MKKEKPKIKKDIDPFDDLIKRAKEKNALVGKVITIKEEKNSKRD